MEVLELPLYNEPDYSYDVSLNRTSYTIRMFYNERSRSWHMDLQDQEGEYIFQGVRIAEETPLYSGSKDAIADGGYFYLMPVGERLEHLHWIVEILTGLIGGVNYTTYSLRVIN